MLFVKFLFIFLLDFLVLNASNPTRSNSNSMSNQHSEIAPVEELDNADSDSDFHSVHDEGEENDNNFLTVLYKSPSQLRTQNADINPPHRVQSLSNAASKSKRHPKRNEKKQEFDVDYLIAQGSFKEHFGLKIAVTKKARVALGQFFDTVSTKTISEMNQELMRISFGPTFREMLSLQYAYDESRELFSEHLRYWLRISKESRPDIYNHGDRLLGQLDVPLFGAKLLRSIGKVFVSMAWIERPGFLGIFTFSRYLRKLYVMKISPALKRVIKVPISYVGHHYKCARDTTGQLCSLQDIDQKRALFMHILEFLYSGFETNLEKVVREVCISILEDNPAEANENARLFNDFGRHFLRRARGDYSDFASPAFEELINRFLL